jgi:hypothetical protein
MEYRSSNRSNSNASGRVSAGWSMGGIVDILGEAENIVRGLKALDTSERPNIFGPPLRIGRPILEPLDSSLEPTPLGPSALIPKLIQRSVVSGLYARVNFTKLMPFADKQVSQPLQFPVGPPPQQEHPLASLRSQQQAAPKQEENNLDLSFSSLDDMPLSLDYIDDLETSPSLVASACFSSDGTDDMASLSSEQVKKRRVRKYKEDQWNVRFQDLLRFRAEEGHVMVPHSYPKNQKLAQWVKRCDTSDCIVHHVILTSFFPP